MEIRLDSPENRPDRFKADQAASLRHTEEHHTLTHTPEHRTL